MAYISTENGTLDTEKINARYEPVFCSKCGCRLGWKDTDLTDDFVGFCDECMRTITNDDE